MTTTFDLNNIGDFLKNNCKIKSKEDISDLEMYQDFYGCNFFKAFIEFLSGIIGSGRLIYDTRYIRMVEESKENKIGISLCMDGRKFPIYSCTNREPVVVPLSIATLLTHLKSVKVGTRVQMYSEKNVNSIVINIDGLVSNIVTIPISGDIPVSIQMEDQHYICSGSLKSLTDICEGFKSITCNEVSIKIYKTFISIVGPSQFGSDDKNQSFGVFIENETLIDTFKPSSDLFKKLLKLKGLSAKTCVQFFYKKEGKRAIFNIQYMIGSFGTMDLYFFKDDVIMNPMTPSYQPINLYQIT